MFSIDVDYERKMDELEFMRGYRDCEKGIDHVSQSNSYDRGYRACYQHEQNMSEMYASKDS